MYAAPTAGQTRPLPRISSKRFDFAGRSRFPLTSAARSQGLPCGSARLRRSGMTALGGLEDHIEEIQVRRGHAQVAEHIHSLGAMMRAVVAHVQHHVPELESGLFA